ncbi:sulfatase-like hydrolase/transferase [Clostridium boliviensis]|uniref:Sulfatase-like hydrolase/transferase n=1 Tax=Clostridium boliviensis TaxID=318465 RepID=A0ABU4GQ14_9CLOT|nr:sulfatase-like hydrolase/transferase [Clostridium boliviensis]MDW2799072.1 sulfatase-like hydrolase/transferase [Clostridium boliviensis]
MSKRPNIIIFNPDQMRADSLAHLGNPASKTPFLDSFAQTEGVSFRNAFCQNPVCVPSRCSFTTGLYPHVHGHRTMSYLLREGESSIFKELKQEGYHVWMNARNDLIAGQIPGLIESHVSEIYYGGESKEAPGPEQALRGKPGSKNYYSMFGGRLGLDKSGRNYGSDDEDLDAAIRKIKDHPKDQPLCMFLGLVNPHPPYQVEEPYYSAIKRDQLPLRRKAKDGAGKPKLEDVIRENQAMEEYTERDWDELRACYLGMCMKVDTMFKKLCDALKEAGEYDNSAIFFFSDHGDYTGDYGLVEKAQNTFEDCLTNVPFLIKPPKGEAVDPGVSEAMVELVDFYATAMDYAQAGPDHTHFSCSLRKVLGDRNESHRSFVCCEGGRLAEEIHCDEFHANGVNGTMPFNPYWPRHAAQADPEAHAKGYMLRTDRWKYVARIDKNDELYCLSEDPKELVNQINKPENRDTVMEMQKELMYWLMQTTDVVPLDLDQRFSPEMTWAKVKKYVPKEYEEEIRGRIAAGVNQFLLVEECKKRFSQ